MRFAAFCYMPCFPVPPRSVGGLIWLDSPLASPSCLELVGTSIGKRRHDASLVSLFFFSVSTLNTELTPLDMFCQNLLFFFSCPPRPAIEGEFTSLRVTNREDKCKRYINDICENRSRLPRIPTGLRILLRAPTGVDGADSGKAASNRNPSRRGGPGHGRSSRGRPTSSAEDAPEASNDFEENSSQDKTRPPKNGNNTGEL